MIGRTLGQYRVDARLGAGGMGVVYRAYDARLQRTVALKVVNKQPAIPLEDDHVLEEARTASGLNHPNICTVYEVADVDGETFIAMEYVAGRPLSQLVPQGGLAYEDTVRYAIEVADALAHAHEHGVVHRDLKSANVVIASGWPGKSARLRDCAAGADRVGRGHVAPAASARKGGIPGTTAYIAPEVLLGEPGRSRSDIWALGVLMFEMATGGHAFRRPQSIRPDLRHHSRCAGGSSPPHVPASFARIILSLPCEKSASSATSGPGEVARRPLEAIQSDRRR